MSPSFFPAENGALFGVAPGVCALWLLLGACYFCVMWASEMFLRCPRGGFRKECVRRGVALALFGRRPNRGGHCGLVRTGLKCVLRCSKSDQFHVPSGGGRVASVYIAQRCAFRREGGAVSLMLQLMYADMHLPPGTPLAA